MIAVVTVTENSVGYIQPDYITVHHPSCGFAQRAVRDGGLVVDIDEASDKTAVVFGREAAVRICTHCRAKPPPTNVVRDRRWKEQGQPMTLQEVEEALQV